MILSPENCLVRAFSQWKTPLTITSLMVMTKSFNPMIRKSTFQLLDLYDF